MARSRVFAPAVREPEHDEGGHPRHARPRWEQHALLRRELDRVRREGEREHADRDPRTSTPSVRSRYRVPSPATRISVPSQIRSATHGGMPSTCSVNQVVRTDREGRPDDLVGSRCRVRSSGPTSSARRQQSSRIEVEVRLRVGVDLPDVRQHQRHVRQQYEAEEADSLPGAGDDRGRGSAIGSAVTRSATFVTYPARSSRKSIRRRATRDHVTHVSLGSG